MFHGSRPPATLKPDRGGRVCCEEIIAELAASQGQAQPLPFGKVGLELSRLATQAHPLSGPFSASVENKPANRSATVSIKSRKPLLSITLRKSGELGFEPNLDTLARYWADRELTPKAFVNMALLKI
jgi:hypothetical protein